VSFHLSQAAFFKKERFFFDLIFEKMKPRAAKLAKRSPIVVFTFILIKIAMPVFDASKTSAPLRKTSKPSQSFY
jgi:hypothetical protein